MVRQYIIINIFLVFLIQSCTKIVPKSQLVFKNCEIYWDNSLFTGEYELNKGEKYILTKVYRGKIKNEKTFSNNYPKTSCRITDKGKIKFEEFFNYLIKMKNE